MENIIILNLTNPIQRAGILSKLIFGWFIKICLKCSKQGLHVNDIYKNLFINKSSILADTLEKNWNREVKLAEINNVNPSFFRALRKTFFWRFTFGGIALLVQMAILRPMQPVLLAIFISLFTNKHVSDLRDLCMHGGFILLTSLLIIFANHHTDLALSKVGMRIRVACSSLVYRKVLRLGQTLSEDDTSGQITNLLSNDVNRFDLVAPMFHHIWVMPIVVIVATYFIWIQVQIAGIVGLVALIILTFPVYLTIGKLLSNLRLKVAVRTDQRVKKMEEIVSGIEVIKMYSWENFFADIVNRSRLGELSYLRKVSYLRGFVSTIFVEKIILFVMVVTYVLLGNNITAVKVFSMSQVINLLQLSMAIYFPMGINYTAETIVSIKRLQNFLLKDEQLTPVIQKNNSREILLDNVKASWNSLTPVLRKIDIKIPAGCLCAIVGPVGVGKSTLLQLLLGELVQDEGYITVGGNISYASQKAWLFASSVRQNILFGKPYDRTLYRTIVKVCALKKDFKILPYGDETLVGDKGVSLSGGQKARINLARAIYRDADIYLLDDPLSAVDSHVGKELFNNCILNHLKNKTRVLVTHQLHYLKEADHIIVLNHGKIEAQGTFEQLSKLDLDFTKLLLASSDKNGKEETKNEDDVKDESITSTLSLSYKIEEDNLKEQEKVEEEIVNDTKVFWKYLRSGGNICMLVLLAVLYIGGQLAMNSTDIWVTYWTYRNNVHNFKFNSTTKNFETHIHKNTPALPTTFIYIYTSLICLCIILLLMASSWLHTILMKCSQNLHSKMFSSLLRAPMKFFNSNPSGRILNRFSRDIGIIDDILPLYIQISVQITLAMIGIIVIVFITNPVMIIVTIILAMFFNKLRKGYTVVARNLKHLEGITKSPVFSHINATCNGIETIRSSHMQSTLKEEFDLHQDTHTSAWYLTIVCTQAYGLWIDFVSFVFLLILIIGFIVMQQFISVNGSIVGLAVSQAIILIGMVQYGMGKVADTISQMTSVERVLEYTNIEGEEPIYKQLEPKPPLWPYEGNIRFENVLLSYSQTKKPVLNNLNFEIKPKEKIGIVGRTGAGKSSIISVLFRLYPIQGNIIIDGINTKTLSLNALRGSISIIPQDPVLFSATIKYNVDPFNQYSDEQIWDTLEKVELKDAISSLGHNVQEGGSNFSVGQRQLICLARAILRKNKILVLDEATANVDPKTDSFIQSAIKKIFQNCTVITIAHRLNTVMDSDRVMVVDQGSIIEFEHPNILLQNNTGHFYKMAMEGNFLKDTDCVAS